MKKRTNNHWVFSLADLAFLLLISLSLIPTAPPDLTLRFAEMDLPEVPDSRSLRPVSEKLEAWELQILAVNKEHSSPFRLARAGEKAGMALDQNSLIPALQKLQEHKIMPMLLPEKTSLSQDFLFAAAALAKVWSAEESRTVVRPMETGAVQ